MLHVVTLSPYISISISISISLSLYVCYLWSNGGRCWKGASKQQTPLRHLSCRQSLEGEFVGVREVETKAISPWFIWDVGVRALRGPTRKQGPAARFFLSLPKVMKVATNSVDAIRLCKQGCRSSVGPWDCHALCILAGAARLSKQFWQLWSWKASGRRTAGAGNFESRNYIKGTSSINGRFSSKPRSITRGYRNFMGKIHGLIWVYMVLYGFMILCEMVKHSPTFYSKHLWFRLSQGPPRWSKMFGPAAAWCDRSLWLNVSWTTRFFLGDLGAKPINAPWISWMPQLAKLVNTWTQLQ